MFSKLSVEVMQAARNRAGAQFYTDAADLDLVCRPLPAQGFNVYSAKLSYGPTSPVALGATIGSSRVKRVPLPGTLLTVMVPPSTLLTML